MSGMRTIEIDFDVHQQIELERTSFDEPPNDALRRLLKLGPAKPSAVKAAPAKPILGRSWSGKGVNLPHGTEVRMEYNGRVHLGVIEDGIWVVEETRSTSPSDAAKQVALTKDGEHPSLNGWIYWQVKRPGDTRWIRAKDLRTK